MRLIVFVLGVLVVLQLTWIRDLSEVVVRLQQQLMNHLILDASRRSECVDEDEDEDPSPMLEPPTSVLEL